MEVIVLTMEVIVLTMEVIVLGLPATPYRIRAYEILTKGKIYKIFKIL